MPALSELDLLVLYGPFGGPASVYRKNISIILLANTVAFGWIPLLRFYDTLMWTYFLYNCANATWLLINAETVPSFYSLIILSSKIAGLYVWQLILFWLG